ncbi:MAG: hypothetical protein ACOYK6_05400 [Chthoniobacterales bacterium]
MNYLLSTNSKIRNIIIFSFLFYNTLALPISNTEEVNQQAREQIILNARRNYAEEKMSLGKKELLNKKYLLAFRAYKDVLDALEKPKLKSIPLHQEALYSLNQSAVLLILEYISLSQYYDAKKIISFITDKNYYFNYPPKNFLVKNFPTIKLKVKSNSNPEILDDIERLLCAGIDFYQQGKWDMAKSKFREALQLDPNNDAAQLGLEIIKQEDNKQISLNAYEEQNKMIDSVDQSWKLPIPIYRTTSQSKANNISAAITKNQALLKKIHNIRIPQIEFIETPLQSALEEIKNMALLFDTEETDSNKKGVNIVLALDLNKLTPKPKITLSLNNTPLEEVLKYVTQQAHLQIRIEPYAIAIIPENESSDRLMTKEYKVPSHFISQFTLFPTSSHFDNNKNIPTTIETPNIKDILLSQGITFPLGATAHYLSSKNILVVKNSPTNLDLITSLLENSFSTPLKQVEIEARFLEVKQNNLNEHGVNWLLGAFQLGCNSNTNTNNKTYQQIGYSNQNQSISTIFTDKSLENISINSGVQTGKVSISAHALETLLFGNPAGAATGTLALAGVLTNPQFQVVLRAINQHKGVDLLSAPKITVSSGRKAIIRIAREFPYPADYSPPQVPQNQGTSVNPAIPTTPSSFKKRNVGVQLEVEPIINGDDNSVDLSLSPQIVEFQGFVNYGSPIFSQAPIFLGGQTNIITSTAHVLLTQNTINQPVFSVREVDTQVVLRDGQTVVLGGLMREDIKKVEERIPIIGNIPLAGALFRSSYEQKIKRNLLIFVTVRLLDSSGKKNH